MYDYIFFLFLGRGDSIIGRHKTRPDTLTIILVKNGTFAWFQLVCDGRTDGRMNGLTDGRTDTPSYRDARSHLKIEHLTKTEQHTMSIEQKLSSI